MKLENAIDDDIQRIPSSQNHSVRQKEKEYTIKNNKNKNSSTVLFNLSKTSRKGGEVSHRIQNLK